MRYNMGVECRLAFFFFIAIIHVLSSWGRSFLPLLEPCPGEVAWSASTTVWFVCLVNGCMSGLGSTIEPGSVSGA